MKQVLAIGLIVLCTAPVLAGTGLPFIQDRYDEALSQAKQRNLPIFVECWAPW